MSNKTYLSDGVYAAYDGYHIVLSTDGNEIYLDDRALTDLIKYVEKVYNVKITVSKKEAVQS